jgi:hypothetical protein
MLNDRDEIVQPEILETGNTLSKPSRREIERMTDSAIHDVSIDQKERAERQVACAPVFAFSIARPVPGSVCIRQLSPCGHCLPWPDNYQ